MKKLFFRLNNTFKVAWLVYKNPQIITYNNLKMLTGLYELIFNVATENKNYMTRIAYVHPEEGEKTIATIWVGAGVNSDPVDRITELISENFELKAQISELIKSPKSALC
jgi:hypothetical protein